MAAEPLPSRTCALCAAESQSGVGYVSYSKEFYCPLCYPKARAERARWSFVRWIAMLAGALFITRTAPPGNSLGWVAINAYTMILFNALVILPHELGHALSGWVMGMRIFRVVVGFGPLLWKGRFMAGTLEIHRYWWSGWTIPLDRRLVGFRRRHWIMIACGPLVNLLLLLAILPLLDRPYHLGSFGQGWDPRSAFLFANLLVLGINLIPMRFRTVHGRQASDGLGLIRTPFLKETEVRVMASLWFLLPEAELLAQGKFEDAGRLHEEGLAEFPESVLLKHNHAVVLLNLRRFDEAREHFLALSASADLDPQNRLLCLSNIAASDVLLERRDLMEEADRYSAEAMASLAWHPSVRVTRGSVLIELGRIEEGLALAKEGLARMDDDRGRAAAACTIAVGLHRKGDLIEGRKYLDMAERTGPRSPRLPQVQTLYGIQRTQ